MISATELDAEPDLPDVIELITADVEALNERWQPRARQDRQDDHDEQHLRGRAHKRTLHDER